MAKTNPKTIARSKRVKRIRKKISGTPERPRLRIFKSSRHIYGQIIDDVAGNTLAAMSTLNQAMKDSGAERKTGKAHKVGMMLAELAKSKGVTEVIFDRGGYIYHGRVKAFSEGARKGGLVF